MSNLITKTTDLAMSVTLAYISEGDTVIDATCGTGQDTVSLARAAGETGTVYAFDIQADAIRLTEERLQNEKGLADVRLVQGSFTSMGEYVPEGTASAVVFNLGYLPGGDHSITTTADETIEGLEAAVRTIRKGGIVTAVLYEGHEAGKTEKQCVLEWARALDKGRFHATYVKLINQSNDPPEILWVTKKK